MINCFVDITLSKYRKHENVYLTNGFKPLKHKGDVVEWSRVQFVRVLPHGYSVPSVD